MKEIKLCDIEGIQIGHMENYESGTGCSVIICREGASGGVDVRGGAPGTRETDLLNPVELVQKVNAVVLSGGSAFGLDASSGVMKYLEEKIQVLMLVLERYLLFVRLYSLILLQEIPA